MPIFVVSGSKNKASNDIKDFNEVTTDQIQNTFSSKNHSHKPGGLL